MPLDTIRLASRAGDLHIFSFQPLWISRVFSGHAEMIHSPTMSPTEQPASQWLTLSEIGHESLRANGQ